MHLTVQPGTRATDKATRQKRDARFYQYVKAYYDTNDEAPLGRLLDEARPHLTAYLRYRGVFIDHLIEDTIQETLFCILGKLRTRQYVLGPGKVFMSWANGVCWFCYLQQSDVANDKFCKPGDSDDPYLLFADVAAPVDLQHLDYEAPMQAAARVLQAATEAMLGLDEPVRAVIASYYYRGMGLQEVCAHLGISLGQFHGRLRKGLEALRSWAKQRPQMAPNLDTYEALRRVDSGELFDDGSTFERAERERKAKSVNNSKRDRKADKARTNERAQQQATERQRLAAEYDAPEYAMAA